MWQAEGQDSSDGWKDGLPDQTCWVQALPVSLGELFDLAKSQLPYLKITRR